MNQIKKYNMKSKTLNPTRCLLLSVMSLLVFSCGTDDTQNINNFYNLTMEENFDTSGVPNPNVWGYDIGTGDNGWGNNEAQYYTNRTENVTVQNGILIITAKKETFNGSQYTSARLLTKGKFDQTYGRFEARIKLPYGQGMWPAFWLLGVEDTADEIWPQIGEIDIMENRGQEPTLIAGSVHGPGYSGGQAITKDYELENDRFDTDFHIFGIEWGPDYINYYVDDELYNQITPADLTGDWVFDNPFYIIINLAVGGDFVGAPTEETVFPQSMLIDYVRVYSNNN